MSAWRTYADPPQADPELSGSERRQRARELRDQIGFEEALRSSATGLVVWMCADALDAVSGPSGVVLDAAHVDDALPGPWEQDLLDLAGRDACTGGAAEALAEGYQSAVAAVAAVPLHAARDEALKRSRQLADTVRAGAAQSAEAAARRHVAPGAGLRRERLSRRWGCDVDEAPDLQAELAQYRESLPEPTARMLAQYRLADAAAGQAGQIMILMSRGSDREDVLLLEAVSAQPSSREADVGAWRDGSDVQRVLLAREVVPLVPAEFAGWSTSADGAVARVWSRARSSTHAPDLGGRRARARRWGATLGLLHATSADAASLAGFIGRSRRFPEAVRRLVGDGA